MADMIISDDAQQCIDGLLLEIADLKRVNAKQSETLRAIAAFMTHVLPDWIEAVAAPRSTAAKGGDHG